MKKNIGKLVQLSKTKALLDAKKIQTVVYQLNRRELREYLLLLKITRSKEKVLVESPIETNWTKKNLLTYFKKLSQGREIEFIQNKELLSGIKITAHDNVLDMTTKGALEKIQQVS